MTIGTVTLAGSDTTIGKIVFGTMTFGAPVEQDEADRMIRTCLDAGVTMFDTSNNYVGGRSEEILGKALAGRRESVQIATKGGSMVEQSDPSVVGLSRKAVSKAIDDSLRRLGTDYIDLYYLHRPDRNTPIEETLEALAEAVAAGKVKALAQSNFAAWQATQMLYLSRANGWPEIRVTQMMYNLLARRVETEYVEASRTLGFTNIAYNPLAGGLLTGKHRRDADPTTGGRFSKAMYRDRYWNDVQFTAIERLQGIANEAGLTLIELSLRWVLGRPATDAMLLGASSIAQLEANLAAIDGPALTDEVLEACDAVWNELLAGVAPHYNR